MSALAPTVRSLTVLVVDDDPDAASSTAAVLVRSGHRVLRAADGEQALALAEADPPAAVVVELMMPGANGVEVARRLRGTGLDGRRVVLVALTRWRGTEVQRWAAEGGFDAVLFKPADPAELLAALGDP